MQLMGIPSQCASHSGDVPVYPQLGGSGEFGEKYLFVSNVGDPYVFSFLGCFPFELLFTTHCFSCHGGDLSLLVFWRS